MKKRNYALCGIVGAILGFGCALVVLSFIGQAPGAERLSTADVVSFAKSTDEGALFPLDVQRTPQFVYICSHLEEMIETADVEESRTLWLMVWRAAFLTGSRQEIAAVFNRYMLSRNAPFTPNYVAHDLSYEDVLTDYLLLESGASRMAIEKFLVGLGNQPPDSWGYRRATNYVPELTWLMRCTERTAGIRSLAAFALARWSDATPLGKEAQNILASLASRDYGAKVLYDNLQALDTERWKHSETQTAK